MKLAGLLLFLPLFTSVVFCQVIIREKVEVKPKPSQMGINVSRTTASGSDYFNPPPVTRSVGLPSLPLPSNVVIHGEIDQSPVSFDEGWAVIIELAGKGSIKTAGREFHSAGGAPYTTDTPFAGVLDAGTVVSGMLLFDYIWGDGTYTTDANGVMNFTGRLIRPVSNFFLDITGRCIITATALPEATFNGWEIIAANSSVNCWDSVRIDFHALNAGGRIVQSRLGGEWTGERYREHRGKR
ncbi:MAG: hypothetical protein HY089_08505 [Ignavibacteriales bacterium]|nr:hypothetical protein [Ignavibacteriales bacterium]